MTTIKTYSRARSAKAALQKILDMHETEGEILTHEIEPGRFVAGVTFDDPIMPELEADLTEQGFGYAVPQVEEEDETFGDEEGEPLPPITPATPRKRSGYINENSNHQGVVAEVHWICDSFPNASRKEIIAKCRAAGIAFGTARTQYQKWFSKRKVAVATVEGEK